MTPNDRRFTAVDDDSLAGMIRSAAHRVVLVAPALGKATAKALLDAADRPGQCPAVDIVLDADEDTCRLGYGDPEGITILQKGFDRLRTPVRRQEGLRIGVLIVDDRLVIWSPTPRSVEADRQPEQPNGLVAAGVTERRPGGDREEVGGESPGPLRSRAANPRLLFALPVRGNDGSRSSPLPRKRTAARDRGAGIVRTR